MLVSAEKSFKTTTGCDGSQVPYSSELQKFFILSRRCQTEFSHAEEYHRSRKFQFHERNLIEEFITNTMFFIKCNKGTTMANTDEEQVVKNITKRIIQESKNYNCEVHFNIIWVYYFIYHDEEINSLPIFKIHKGRGNGQVYVDAFSNVYQTWSCFIDGPGLGESLLCAPRNGEYSFEGDKLRLEYVQKKGLQRGYKSTSTLWVTHVSPLFQNLQDWLTEVKSWLSKHLEIGAIVKKLLNFFQANGKEILSFAQALLLAYFKCQLTGNSQIMEFALLSLQAAKIIFNHLNSQGKSEVSGEFLTETEKTVANNWGCYAEAKELEGLLNSPSKNWIEILDLICCLIKKIRTRGTIQNSKQHTSIN